MKGIGKMGIDLLLTFVGKCFEFGQQEAFGVDRPVVMLDIFSGLIAQLALGYRVTDIVDRIH